MGTSRVASGASSAVAFVLTLALTAPLVRAEPTMPRGPADALAAILAKRSGEALDAQFRQTKHIALLRDPLVSTGRVRFELPSGLRWEVVEPEPLVVDTRGGTLRTGTPGDLREVPAAALGPFAALPGGFSGVFGATADEIVSAFDVTQGSSEGAFRLTPKAPDLARALTAIDLVLDPATGVPKRVVLHESGGDSSEIEIFD